MSFFKAVTIPSRPNITPEVERTDESSLTHIQRLSALVVVLASIRLDDYAFVYRSCVQVSTPSTADPI